MRRILSLFVSLLLLCSVCGRSFANTIFLPDGINTIPEEVFAGDTSLDRVEVPSNVNSIGDRAFADSSLKKIVLPDSVSFISDSAFENVNDLIIQSS